MLNERGELTEVPEHLRGLASAIGRQPSPTPRAANDNLPRLLALTGEAGSGKSTATAYLVERHGYTLVKFAGPLKDMCRAVGMTEQEIEGGLKETQSDRLCGKTPRQFMQRLGTEFGRDCIGPAFWSNIWRGRTTAILAAGGRVIVDDCRFPNEAASIHELGGKIIRLTGRGGIQGAHQSEQGCGVADAVVANDGCVMDLYAGVEEEVLRWAA